MNRNLLIVIMLLLSCFQTFGQISTEEEPVSFRMNVPVLTRSEKVQKVMPVLDMKKLEQEDTEDEANGIPPRFGYRHEVNYNLENSGEWTVLPNGDKIWRLIISCPGALSINLLYDKFRLPDETKFFIYSGDRKHSIGAFTSVNNKGDEKDIQGFATGLVYGDRVTLEYYLPDSVKETGIISIAYVVHGYRYIYLPESNTRGYGNSGDCQVNINCSEGQNWQNEKNAVAMILVNGNRYCTGSLVNTTANDYRPLFLTADHCLGGWANDVKHDAIGDSILSHWSFYWHYESPRCTNAPLSAIHSTSGATVVANNSISDFALLRLTEDPRNKAHVTPYYLGWERSSSADMAWGCVGIHHPSGDLKKIATYNQNPQNYSNNNFWKLNWIQTPNGYSVTEGGSSGSPLINHGRKVIGQLFGGSSVDCSDPANDDAVYGKFSVSWTGNGATDNRRKLQPWLDPLGTNPTALNGPLYISGPAEICPQVPGFFSLSIPNGYTHTWSTSANSGLTIMPGPPGSRPPSIMVRIRENGSGYLYATLTSPADTIRLSKFITVKRPEQPYHIIAQMYGDVTPIYVNHDGIVYRPDYIYDFSIPNWQDYTSYSWIVYGGTIQSGQGTSQIRVLTRSVTPSGFGIGFSGYGAGCGSKSEILYYSGVIMDSKSAHDDASIVPDLTADAEDSPVLSYPNPASNILNIEIDAAAIARAKALEQTTTDAPRLKTEPTFDIRLYDSQGTLLRNAKTKGGKVEFNVTSLPNGIYYLHIYDGVTGKPEIRQIMVEH